MLVSMGKSKSVQLNWEPLQRTSCNGCGSGVLRRRAVPNQTFTAIVHGRLISRTEGLPSPLRKSSSLGLASIKMHQIMGMLSWDQQVSAIIAHCSFKPNSTLPSLHQALC